MFYFFRQSTFRPSRHRTYIQVIIQATSRKSFIATKRKMWSLNHFFVKREVKSLSHCDAMESWLRHELYTSRSKPLTKLSKKPPLWIPTTCRNDKSSPCHKNFHQGAKFGRSRADLESLCLSHRAQNCKMTSNEETKGNKASETIYVQVKKWEKSLCLY